MTCCLSDQSSVEEPDGHCSMGLLNKIGTAWLLGDDDETFETASDGSTGVRSAPPHTRNSLSPSSIPQFYYTTPPRAQMATTPTSEERSRLERAGSGKGSGFSRIARRLSQKDRRNTEERRKALRQRSVSLDCGDNRRSLMSDNLEPPGDRNEQDSLSIPASPSMPNKLITKNNSTPNLPGRLSRKASGNKSKKGSHTDLVDSPSSKDKRRRNTAALFEAVEYQDMDKAREILDANGIDVNSTNDEDLTLLDIAVMTNHVPMTRMLLSFGARESPAFQRCNDTRSAKLDALGEEAERRINELNSWFLSNSPGGSTASASQYKDTERQLFNWEFRVKLYRHMKTSYDNADPPEPPSNVSLTVISNTSLLVKFDEPLHHNGAVVSKYKVEWSCFEDFAPLVGEQIIIDPQFTCYEIPDLSPGNAYYVRVAACNIKGYGDSAVASPAYAVPSTWREVELCKPRLEGKLQLLNDLFINIKNARPADAPEIKDAQGPAGTGSPLHPRKSTMRKSLKNLFSSAPKFQKTLKRGVYLSCLLFHEDRVLVTNEELLPVLEVDEHFTSTSLNADLHWIMKVACTWEDVKSLRQDMDKSVSSGNVQFRSKLLQAAGQLQSVLGVQDLGQFYYQPIRDPSGCVILATVNVLQDPKAVNTTHIKWVSLTKLQRRMISGNEIPAAPESLLNVASEIMCYQAASTKPLARGLYVGYLKLKSSMDLIRIMVPECSPNVVPHVKVRDYPNVTKEEWEWLHALSLNNTQALPTATQTTFQKDVVSACSRLLDQLGISDDAAVSHRLYDVEVIELNKDVAFLLVLPPVENVCSVPGHHEEITQLPNFVTLPVQVFEMIHMSTYQYDFISRYTRLSSILEIDTHLAQQSHREAFSSDEVNSAKDRLEKLANFQQTLDEAWRGMRWTMDIITHARDRSVRGGLALGILNAPPPSPSESPLFDRRDLDKGKSSSSSDVASSTCSDCGYHSDIGSVDSCHQNIEGQTQGHKLSCHGNRDSGICTCGSSLRLDGEGDREEVWTRASAQPPGILRVYSAYDTGLGKGTSVKLHITPRTTSREVISLVVQQLNKALMSKGVSRPVYTDEDMDDFCLVAVIGARERVLRSDYQPLQLQNPWTKGRLFVRLKRNILAAIEQSQVTTV